MKKNQINVIDEYAKLARKLGKLPSVRECRRLGLSPDKVRYHFDNHTKLKAAALQRYPQLEELEVPVGITSEDIATHRLDTLKKDIKSTNKNIVSSVNTYDFIADFADNVFKGRVKAGKLPNKNFQAKRVHTLILSDLHFGADIDGEETGVHNYQKTEEARRFAAVIKQAASYKVQYRKNTKLVIALLGDIVENAMHDARTGDVIALQCCRAIHLLLQGVAYLANHYPEVEVVCATGNHDRNTARHHGRAVHGKYDSLSTVIYFSLKSALNHVKNVTVTIPKTPLGYYEVFGKRIGYTHGDTVLNPGNPYKTVNVKGLEAQVNDINAALPDKNEFSAILYGHTHLAHVVHLPNGCVLIGNGSLPPPDPFSVSIGKFRTNNGMWIFESVEGHPVGDMRLIRTGEQYDKDDSLDKIIKPWESL